VAEEGVAPHLAVGDDVEAAGFLQRDRLIDRAIFDPLEFGGRHVAALATVACFRQVRRAKEASDDIASPSVHRVLCSV
jgi:hypothetical protein